jgi:hypothetical protein
MIRIAGLTMLVVLVFASSRADAQTYSGGTVLQWETKAYSQSAHITRNQIVYSVRVEGSTYEIARQRDNVEFTPGQQLTCSIRDNHFFVVREHGKEAKYDILGVESAKEGTPRNE